MFNLTLKADQVRFSLKYTIYQTEVQPIFLKFYFVLVATVLEIFDYLFESIASIKAYFGCYVSWLSNMVTPCLISTRHEYLESYFEPTTCQRSALPQSMFYCVIL